MVSLRTKELQGPLFGVVDDKAKLRLAFSSPCGARDLVIDDADLDHVAEYTGLDAEDGVRMLSRFVSGRWRIGADAPGGTALGDFGEVLSFLQLFGSGKRPVRVVSYQRGSAPRGVDNFPMPDFLLEDGGQTGCVEVKSSCSLDYFDLEEVVESSSKHRWRQLAPCTAVPPRWKDALRQLGHTDAGPSLPLHDLVLKDKRTLKFPVDFGIAHIHLVHDSRVNGLRVRATANRMKTPGECLLLGRDCWACMGDPSRASGVDPGVDVMSLHLHNEPGRLGLLGSGGPDKGTAWREAYRGWTLALWTRDPVLVESADETLARATEEWVRAGQLATGVAGAAVLMGWNGYLSRAAASRGLRAVGLRERFPDATPGDETATATQDEPEVTLADSLTSQHFADRVPRRVRVAHGITVYADRDSVELRTSGSGTSSEAVARALCIKLVEVALTVFHGLEGHHVFLEGELSPVAVRAGDKAHVLGWRFGSPRLPSECVALVQRPDGTIEQSGTLWTVALCLGDPRARMGVHDDGRAYLRFPRSLADEPSRVFFRP